LGLKEKDMPILMSDIYAGEQGVYDTQTKRLLLEENKLKLAEQMRARDEAAQARAILTRRANEEPVNLPVQNQYPGQVAEQSITDGAMPLSAPVENRGLIPQAELTGFGGMSTPQEGPMGLQPQEGLTGLGGMSAPTGMVPEQAPVQEVAPVKNNLISSFDKTETAVNQAQSKLSQVKQAAMEMRKAGLHDQADAYELKTYKLQEAADNAQKAHLEVTEKVADYIGSQANGYLETVSDPTANKEAAWQRLKLRLQMDGFETEELDAVPPEQREAYAEQARSAAVSSKDQITLQKTLLQEQRRDKRNQDSISSREKLTGIRTRANARIQEGIQTRWEATQDQRQFKNAEGILNKNITAAQADRREIDSQVKDLNFKISGIRSGTIITDETGKPYTREARELELSALQDRLSDLDASRQELTKEIDTHEEHLKTLADSFKKGGGSEPTKPVALDKSVQSQLVEAINKHPDQLETIKSNFAELYPGLKFEDYIKVNVNSKAFKKTK
jgi:hypothetical protein